MDALLAQNDTGQDAVQPTGTEAQAPDFFSIAIHVHLY
jgi:hypothetical protein